VTVSKRIYLAGGMHNNWRGIIYNGLGDRNSYYSFLDPMEHNLREPDQYTFWDLRAIEKCDILLGYMDKTNPSGYGLNLEIGYAKALGKTILLVVPTDFWRDDPRAKYFRMAETCADILVTTLYDAVRVLKEIEHV
jgi:nucleoside 2-deoxyribosyltransferase